MSVKERLLSFISYKRLNIKRFQESIAVSNSYVANINQGIGSPVLMKLEKVYPELNIDWLINGSGEMIKEPKEQTPTLTSSVLVLPIAAQAGRLTEFVASVSENDCEKMCSPINDVDYAIQITGDSMEPEYPNGSRVFIKKINEKAFIDWGRTFVLDTCNGVVVKKIYPSSDNTHVLCVSVNPAYPNFEIHVNDIYGWYRVLGQFTLR